VTPPQRLAIIFDAVEEHWPSMEYAAEMLLSTLQSEHSDRFTSVAVRPRFFRGFDGASGLSKRSAWNANRFVTRFMTYPWQLRGARREFDLFHIADHTYAQLALVLPAGRTGIYCHDVDAFAPALEPRKHPAWRSAMARLQLAGLRRAARIFFSTEQMRELILAQRVVEASRLIHAPLGVADEFFRPNDADLPELIRGVPYILNVAGNLPRKRLDTLFQVFARIHRERSELRLVQHGAPLEEPQRALLQELRVSESVLQTPPLTRAGLAALYRHARLVLLTSEREGFGFPVAEALAAGAVVVLSDIPAFREAAGAAGVFCPPGDIDRWVEVVRALLKGSLSPPPASLRAKRARAFSWTVHADTVATTYALIGAAP
jgi:glycosyltransferase involved in cell wall biosynthesis